VRQSVTASLVEIVPAAEVIYRGVTFSRDGDFIYYTMYGKNLGLGTLYKVPALGGVAVRVIEDCDSPASFSPDGRQFAFVRFYLKERESALVVADIEGGERVLAKKKTPERFSSEGPAFSPDGLSIACAARVIEGGVPHTLILEIDARDGTERLLTRKKWNYVGQLAWQGDGRGVIAIAWGQESSVPSDQVWRIGYPEGEAHRITNDLNGYRGLSLSNDSISLVTTQTVRHSQIFVSPDQRASRVERITSGFGDYLSDRLGCAWTPDGRIVYSSSASGNPDLWIMNSDGSFQKRLTVDDRGDLMPAVTRDGRYIIFVSERMGPANIWRMRIDGSDPRRLTDGAGEYSPALSPDGKWVIYSSEADGHPSVWRVSIDGGTRTRIVDGQLTNPAVSPDGRFIAGFRLDVQKMQMMINIVPFEGGDPVMALRDTPVIYPPMIRWTADSRALTYVVTREGVSNIWLHPVDGSPARQLTSFDSERIFRFAWSMDGHRLLFERGSDINDLVLISNLD
jgi:Tol biopolymer transport system component